jgi:hypothetical protein
MSFNNNKIKGLVIVEYPLYPQKFKNESLSGKIIPAKKINNPGIIIVASPTHKMDLKVLFIFL